MDWGDTGGGFMVSEEPQQLNTSVSIGGDDKVKSITSVSVSQIAKLTRPNEGLIIHGHKVYHVNLIAMVSEIIDINTQKINILVDDYTSGGPLEVNHILGDTGGPGDDPDLLQQEDTNRPKSLHDLKTGDYVRCVGVVKFNQDKSNMIAYHLKIVEDPNDVTMHTLEVIRDSMWYERTGSAPLADSASRINASAATGGGNMQGQQGGNDFGRLSTRDKHLLKFLREKAPRDGISIDVIAENFRAFSRSDIEESLSTLSAEGLCWNGDSEDIWIVET